MSICAVFIALLCAFLITPAAPAKAGTHIIQVVDLPTMSDIEAAAQAHCPRDVVVWMNIPPGISHEKGMLLYFCTKHGAYCMKEADAAGEVDTRNEQ